jgi:hypothetical protein
MCNLNKCLQVLDKKCRLNPNWHRRNSNSKCWRTLKPSNTVCKGANWFIAIRLPLLLLVLIILAIHYRISTIQSIKTQPCFSTSSTRHSNEALLIVEEVSLKKLLLSNSHKYCFLTAMTWWTSLMWDSTSNWYQTSMSAKRFWWIRAIRI